MRAAGRQPFNDQDMIERLKSRTLTAEDVRADIDAWLEAVMVVTTPSCQSFARKAFCQTPRRVRHPVPK
jgi:hypothetical protein